jgi:hypothetical protein
MEALLAPTNAPIILFVFIMLIDSMKIWGLYEVHASIKLRDVLMLCMWVIELFTGNWEVCIILSIGMVIANLLSLFHSQFCYTHYHDQESNVRISLTRDFRTCLYVFSTFWLVKLLEFLQATYFTNA